MHSKKIVEYFIRTQRPQNVQYGSMASICQNIQKVPTFVCFYAFLSSFCHTTWLRMLKRFRNINRSRGVFFDETEADFQWKRS